MFLILIFNSADTCAKRGEFFHKVFVATLNEVDILHNGRTLSHQAGNNQCRACAQIVSSDGCAVKLLHANHSGSFAGDLDVCTHALQLRAIAEETSLIDAFCQAADTCSPSHTHADLRLHIRGEAGIGTGLNSGLAQVTVADNPDGIIVIDDFDTADGKDWSWSVQTSRFIADGFPKSGYVPGIPNSLRPLRTPEDPEAMVFGVNVSYDRKGDNWFEVYPSKDDKPMELPFIGTVSQIDFWVWGANYNYNLEVLVRDADGRVITLKCGKLTFHGWRNVVINVPGYIKQHSRMKFGGFFRVRLNY